MYIKQTQHTAKTESQIGATHFHYFLESYPLSYLTVDSTHWQYRLYGPGPATLLILPGAPGLSCTSFQDILFFASDFRILVPDYPAQTTTLLQFMHDLAALLTTLNISQVYLIGGSYGGLLAHTFVHYYPEKVTKLVLSHCSLPRRSRARLLSLIHALVTLSPAPLIRTLTRSGLPIFMRSFPDQDGLWYACFAYVMDTLQKSDYLARLRVHIDFDRNAALSRPIPSPWQGPTLLLEADDDPYSTIRERSTLQSIYPQATTYTFQQTAHYAWARDPQRYFSLIKAFLLS